MYRSPVRHQRSPGAPRPPGRFPSPAQGWSFPGTRAQPPCSPGSNRGFEGQNWDQGFGFRRPQSFSPNPQSRTSEVPVEKYFSPSMLEDPWRSLQPLSAARRTP
ncbi:M-phase-specific PLK1-interacting protein [Austrofundulus limnaeus]|uniref:M-phase-specific PLK1-interacting protein n=1 Tax=Austrofundulus limnaeus TaxID=52670 RepID=A0A2I4AI92_AUSLI|nr:PREDICTED: M-phase-specific PLK1-interacting protein [Austrofundulus limnaeus]